MHWLIVLLIVVSVLGLIYYLLVYELPLPPGVVVVVKWVFVLSLIICLLQLIGLPGPFPVPSLLGGK